MNITTQDVAQKVRELAAERPDFVYRPIIIPRGRGVSCSYVTGADGVGCIVGEALTALGHDFGGTSPALEVTELLNALYVGDDGSGTSDHVSHWLQRVQNFQDASCPWWQAVAVADVEVPL